MRTLWRISKTFQFEAAHVVDTQKDVPGLPCTSLHGHNYKVKIVLESEHLDPQTMMLIDFYLVKKAFSNIVSKLDHSLLLNKSIVKDYEDLNAKIVALDSTPTSEYLSYWIFHEFLKELRDTIYKLPEERIKSIPKDLALVRVRVYETEKSYSEYESKATIF